MSKARSMYAGSSGMINGANVMTVQFGNKLQGLAPTTESPFNFHLDKFHEQFFSPNKSNWALKISPDLSCPLS